MIHITIFQLIIQLKGKRKYRSFTPLTFEANISPKLINDFVRNTQTKAYAPSIHILSGLNKSKQLKQLRLVLIFDAKTSILDLYLKEACTILISEESVEQINASSFLCELDTVWL